MGLFSLLIVTVWMNTFLGVCAVAALLVVAGVLVLAEPPLTHTKVLEMAINTNLYRGMFQLTCRGPRLLPRPHGTPLWRGGTSSWTL